MTNKRTPLLVLALLLAGCSSGASPSESAPVEDHDAPGAIRGELAVYIATFDDGN